MYLTDRSEKVFWFFLKYLYIYQFVIPAKEGWVLLQKVSTHKYQHKSSLVHIHMSWFASQSAEADSVKMTHDIFTISGHPRGGTQQKYPTRLNKIITF